jgi:hypothetical protein
MLSIINEKINYAFMENNANENNPNQFEYFEIDSEINIENFNTEGVPLVNFDKQLIIDLVGMDNCLSPNKTFDKKSEKPLSSSEHQYISNIWINKHLFSRLTEIINRYNLSITADTIAIVVLIIEKTYLRVENLKAIAVQKSPLSDEQKVILEIGEFTEIMRKIAASESINSQIDIFINNQRVLAADGKNIMFEILKWYHSYYFNKDRAYQYFWDGLKYEHSKKQILPKTNIYISYGADFKKIVCKNLNNQLNNFFNKSADKINFIGEILSTRNIFGFDKMERKSIYDTILRAINSEYRNL